jgi:hypothetical protein
MFLATSLVSILILLLAVSHAAAVPGDDSFIAGYAAAVLEREFSLTVPSLRVENGVVSLAASDIATVDRARVVAELEKIRGVARVVVLEPGAVPPLTQSITTTTTPAEPPRVLTEWQAGIFPGSLLFAPLIADPRWPRFGASWQHYVGDKNFSNLAAVSFGESFAFYRDRIGSAWWEVGLQAGVFSLFDIDSPSFDLVNADYMVALPFSLRYEDFSTQFRVFHQSSHLGDEFLLGTRTNRINYTYGAVDLRFSYEFADIVRPYAGVGYLFGQTPSNVDRLWVQYGVEFRSPWPTRASRWRPIVAVNVKQQEENNWSADVSARAGIEIDGVLLTRKLQILLEYFNGYSPDGQFYKDKVEYFGIGAQFHF